MKQIRKRLTYANVMSSIAVFLVLGGATAFAAGHLGKNTVGTKQLKKNAVTKAKIKKNAVNGAKVKSHSLTGADINLAKLGTVPNATHADNAAKADSASNAAHATVADSANAIAAPEATHLIGAPGEPSFESASHNATIESGGAIIEPFQPAGFYKDRQGIVHLEGVVETGEPEGFAAIFTLPAGFRPANGKIQAFPTIAENSVVAFGSGVTLEGNTFNGQVVSNPGELVVLSGITFRAEG